MRLRCFIAMASGKNDTNRLYKDQIKPALKRHHVTPDFIEQQEHNDDIDDRIISRLKTCDFAIADLTYARPSVYFEAGFAQREVPVVYTCRTDHFEPRPKGVPDDYRIHFDLQMKNTIRWSSSSDKVFAQRLGSRISRIIRPLLTARREKQRERQQVDTFSALPIKERIDLLLNESLRCLKRARYRGRHFDSRSIDPSKLFRVLIDSSGRDLWPRRLIVNEVESTWLMALRNLHSGWIGSRLEKATIRVAAVYVAENLTKNILERLNVAILEAPAYDFAPALQAGRVQNLVEHVFLCSLRSVPANRVASSLVDYHLTNSGNEFVKAGKQLIPASSVVGYKEVYMLQQWQETFCLVHNPSRRGYDSEINVLPTTEVLRVQKVPRIQKYEVDVRSVTRSLHVHVIHGIKSFESFKGAFSKELKRAEPAGLRGRT
jgi:hypothetical protein